MCGPLELGIDGMRRDARSYVRARALAVGILLDGSLFLVSWGGRLFCLPEGCRVLSPKDDFVSSRKNSGARGRRKKRLN